MIFNSRWFLSDLFPRRRTGDQKVKRTGKLEIRRSSTSYSSYQARSLRSAASFILFAGVNGTKSAES